MAVDTRAAETVRAHPARLADRRDFSVALCVASHSGVVPMLVYLDKQGPLSQCDAVRRRLGFEAWAGSSRG